MANKIYHIDVQVPQQLKEELKIISVKEGRSMTKIVTELIKNYIEDKKQKGEY